MLRQSDPSPETESADRISVPYLLVLNIALIEKDGRYWADPLWHKDLLLHLVAIDRLTLACPVEHRPVPADWLPIDDPRITILPFPPFGRRSYLDLPAHARRLERAIGDAAIVHTGVAGWPYPLGWLAARIARKQGRFLLINVESSFWRVPEGTQAGVGKRAKAAVWERINRACLNACDLTFFTTEAYRASLLQHPRGPSHVMPASWVDADRLADPAAIAARTPHARLLFAGRLTEQKGVAVLLAALERSTAQVDLIGEGEMADAVRAVAARFPDRVRLLEPVAYGVDFFALLDRYAAIVVPTLSDEQPRILFDAFARGLPAIASDTPGNAQLVHEGVEGWLVAKGDAGALAAALDRAAADPGALAAMGRTARATMDDRTHEAMHRTRARLIRDAFSKSGNTRLG